MPKDETIILIGTAIGTIARFYTLRVDYRQYPGYPQGYLLHLTLGLIAAALGAVALPALLKKEYAAVTFLVLATQQFREIRNMERESLINIEKTELVKRGDAYIEDIARKFEARNYLALLTGLITCGTIITTKRLDIGIIVGIILLISLKFVLTPKQIGSIAVVRQGEFKFEGTMLDVEGNKLTNVGLKEARERYIERGLAMVIEPKDDNANTTLSNLGQRQAILHDVSIQLGIRRENDEPEFTPIAKRDSKSGRIAIFMIPYEKDIECMIEAAKRVPILESSRRLPLSSEAGSAASD